MSFESRLLKAAERLAPPVAQATPEDRLRTRVLVVSGIVGAFVCIGFLGHRAVTGERELARYLPLAISMVLFAATPFVLRAFGRVPATRTLLSTLALAMSADAYAYGGLGAPAFIALLVLPILATLLLGARAGWRTLGACVLIVVAFLVVQLVGTPLPAPVGEPDAAIMNATALVGILGFVTALVQVYERRRVANEQLLAESEVKYRTAFFATNLGLLIVRGDSVQLSEPLVRHLGLDSPTLSRSRLLELVVEPGAAQLARMLDRPDEGAHAFQLCRADGRVVWVSCRAERADDEVRLMVRDIDREKRVEALKDEFVSNVSHELRTPLTAIRGSLGLLASGKVPQARRVEMIDLAKRNTERLLRLVDDLLDVQKLEAGAFEMQLATLRLDDEVRASVEGIAQTLREKDMQIAVRGEGVEVVADSGRLRQVLLNLLSNAVKFSEPGATIRVYWDLDGDYVRVTVEDEGMGMSKDLQARLFDKFVQGPESLAGKIKGTGLGLSICRSIVQQMGGEIAVSSEVGKGSRLHFTLPRRARVSPSV